MPYLQSRSRLCLAVLFVLGCQPDETATLAQEDPKAAQEEAGQYFHWVDERKVPLTLDIERFFVLRKGDNPDQSASDLSIAAWEQAKRHPEGLDKTLGVAPHAIKPNDKVRMWEVDVSQRKYVAAQVEDLLEALAARPDIEFAGPAFKTDLGSIVPTGFLIVIFWPDVTDEEAERIIAESGVGTVEAHRHLRMPNHVRVRAATENGLRVLGLANSLHGRPGVRGAEPDWYVSGKAALIPNDPAFGLQWGLHNTGQLGGFNDVDIDGPEAWDRAVTTRGITVLILDDGVQRNHPDLNYDLRFGLDFTPAPAPPAGDGGPVTPNDRHGTAVAGVCCPRFNNEIGIAGVAPGAFCVSARIYAPDAGGFFTANAAAIAAGIRYSLDCGARITNSSFALPMELLVISAAYDDTADVGIIHFAASGNDSNPNGVRYPASHGFVHAVGAIDNTGLVTDFSNGGFDLDFVAPGKDIFTTDRTGSAGYNCCEGNTDYTIADGQGIDGTSFASPCAAGVAALLLRRNPHLSAAAVYEAIRSTSVDISPQVYGFGFDTRTGWGMINANGTLGSTSLAKFGDANGDNVVDFNDILTVLANFGSEEFNGDADYNGLVEFNDILTVLANFGA